MCEKGSSTTTQSKKHLSLFRRDLKRFNSSREIRMKLRLWVLQKKFKSLFNCCLKVGRKHEQMSLGEKKYSPGFVTWTFVTHYWLLPKKCLECILILLFSHCNWKMTFFQIYLSIFLSLLKPNKEKLLIFFRSQKWIMPGISMKYINVLIRYNNTEPSPKYVTVTHHLRTA